MSSLDTTAAPSRESAGSWSLPPLTGGKLLAGTLALSLTGFMCVLDTSIANVALPSIAGDLGVSTDQGTWVVTLFGVANAIAVPLTGWMTQRFGQVRLFVTAVLLFSLFSWLCGSAQSLEMLVLFRVLQGAAAGPIIPLSQTLLLASYPKERSGTALGMWGLAAMVAPVMGPLLGGWITDNIAWPWIFYINVPFGALAAAVTWMLYRKRETPRQQLPIDLVGLGLLMLWVGAMQIMIDRGRDLDWFASSEIVVLTLIAVIGFVLFIIWELYEAQPIVDLRLFGRRNFWTATLALALGYGVMLGNIVLLPLWLQQSLGYTATWAGFVMAPVGIFAVLLTPLIGRNMHKVDTRLLSTLSMLVFALVMWLRSNLTPDAGFANLLLPTVIQGIALSLLILPFTSLALAGLKPEQVPAASGLSNFLRITAGSFGTSIATTVWANRASLHHAQMAEHVSIFDPATTATVASMQANGLSLEQAGAAIDRLINQQALAFAATDVFAASALIFLLLIPVVWLARPGASSDAGAAAAGAH
ncbi:MAG TPA: DHA2 family efflux MFS transporter permease subunit [Candidatus Acidoferrum sp.]|nr:DHA2 family efflux MFS transporter permease subunit [Candidatus Acidoferrum sp.]